MFTVGYGLNKPWYLHRVGSHAAVTIINNNDKSRNSVCFNMEEP